MENNKLIAEFMGLKDSQVNEARNGIEWVTQTKGLKYESSWDWLMPVVEKIESTFQIGTGDLCKVYISANNDPKDSFYYCSIFGSEDHQFNEESKNSKINSVYKAVVEFINWYNKQLEN